MGLFSNKISREKLKPGDHIYSWRAAYVYAHHGIYIGDGKVIHFTRGGGLETETETETEMETFLKKFIASSVVNIPPCVICRDHSKSDGVISTCLDCFLAGGKLYLFEYNVSKVKFLAKPRSGTCTLATTDPPEEVLSRANFLLLGNGFGDYNVRHNNCENFAIYCKTGLVNCFSSKGSGMSGQADSAGAVSAAVLTAVMVGLPLAGFGVYCASRLFHDIGIPKPTVIKVPVEQLAMSNRLDHPWERLATLTRDNKSVRVTVRTIHVSR